MSPGTFDLLTAHMADEDWNSLRATVCTALSNAGQSTIGLSLERDQLTEILHCLPEQIFLTAFQWGFGDVVVADNIMRYLRERLQDGGSLAALRPLVPE